MHCFDRDIPTMTDIPFIPLQYAERLVATPKPFSWNLFRVKVG